MLPLFPRDLGRPLRVLAVGAHPDDIEIGAGGTLLQLAQADPDVHVDIVVLSGTAERAEEAHKSAAAFLPGIDYSVQVYDLTDGRLPAAWRRAKDALEELAGSRPRPDLIFAPSRDDSHQDHRTVAELLPTVFRGVLTLHYEIGKWDGDLVRRSVYVPLSDDIATRKVDLLLENFPSQHGRAWYDSEVFMGLARLRGMECESRYAEAFACSKMSIDLTRGNAS
jgi:LmbE family N-acetylglucosaminyl deacetylase